MRMKYLRITSWALALLLLSSSVRCGLAVNSPTEGKEGLRWEEELPPRVFYRIDCRADPAAGHLEGTEIVDLANTSANPIEELKIRWPLHGSLHVFLRDKALDCRSVNEPEKKDARGTRIARLPSAVAPGDSVRLKIKFRLSNLSSRNKNCFTTCDWHPCLWWGRETHSSYSVKLQTPAEYMVATSGRFDHETERYSSNNVRAFGLFMGKGHGSLTANAGNVDICVIYPPKASTCARLLLDTAVDVINYYRERFGFYPYSTLTIVPGAEYPAGGYPVATSLVAIHGMEKMELKPKLHWQWITAHEIGHQYWMEYVLKDSESCGWLMIGLGVYADREYVEARALGSGMHRGMIRRYTRGVQLGLDTRLNRTAEERANCRFDYNNVVTHGKGYSVISALESTLGEETFGRVYQFCLRHFAGRMLDVARFRAVCDSEASRDMGWFFDQWVNSNRFLSYRVISTSSREEGDYYVSRVGTECMGDLRMPIPIEAHFEDGSTQKKLSDRFVGVDYVEFRSSSPLKKAILDPEGRLAFVSIE